MIFAISAMSRSVLGKNQMALTIPLFGVLIALATACDRREGEVQIPDAVQPTTKNAEAGISSRPADIPAAPLPAACMETVEVSDQSVLLEPGTCIRSPSGTVVLHFTPSSRLELVRNGTAGPEVLWRSQSQPGDNYRLAIQTDGNIVIYADGGLPVWDIRVSGHTGPFRLEIGDDGVARYLDLSDYDTSPSVVWALPPQP